MRFAGVTGAVRHAEFAAGEGLGGTAVGLIAVAGKGTQGRSGREHEGHEEGSRSAATTPKDSEIVLQLAPLASRGERVCRKHREATLWS